MLALLHVIEHICLKNHPSWYYKTAAMLQYGLCWKAACSGWPHEGPLRENTLKACSTD